MAYLSGFNLKASTTAIRAEVNNQPCSVKNLFTCSSAILLISRYFLLPFLTLEPNCSSLFFSF
jgi:hypothetical protein